MLPFAYRKACVCTSPTRDEYPTITPEQLIALASAMVPPSVPRSCIPCAESQRKASLAPRIAVSELPTTCPMQLFPKAKLLAPPSVPKSSIFRLASHNTAWVAAFPVVRDQQAIWLAASAELDEPRHR
jgi:hypothetical protein